MLISPRIQSLVTDLNVLVAGSKMETNRQTNSNKITKKSSEKNSANVFQLMTLIDSFVLNNSYFCQLLLVIRTSEGISY